MGKFLRIKPVDNVAVAVAPVKKGDEIGIDGISIPALEDIPQGHKIALEDIPAGGTITKYSYPIGSAKCDIPAGAWVHTHNVRTNLSEGREYEYNPKTYPQPEAQPLTFKGFLRPDGRAATRNEIWIIPTVGCVNDVARAIAGQSQKLIGGSLEGIYAFEHPYGCSQMGDDLAQTKKLLAALCRHPNAAGVLVLNLGCENNTIDDFKAELGKWDDERVKFLVCQEVEDELTAAEPLMEELAQYAKTFERQDIPAGKLIVGLKCGASDGLSGITANPTVGAFSDYLTACGGTTILTEVPEMFGGEGVILDRCRDEETFNKAVNMINGFKEYFISHGQVVYENPSPGNKQGGITTLEDKSLGNVQKSGTSPICGVLGYGDAVEYPGVNLMYGPGNDMVSITALTAAGAQIVLFTTGRGTPFAAPAPTVKIATNNAIATRKHGWIDFSAASVAEGESVADAGKRLLEFVLEVASGKKTRNEQDGYRGIAIFKDGVTM